MIFEQYWEYSKSHIREYESFYDEFDDIEQYGNKSEISLEEMFLKTFQGCIKIFDKPILLLCFDEDGEKLVLETKIQTKSKEKVSLYKVCDSNHKFPFDEEIMMLKVESEEGNIRTFKFNSEFYSLEEEPEKLRKAKEIMEQKSIGTDGFELFLISYH